MRGQQTNERGKGKRERKQGREIGRADIKRKQMERNYSYEIALPI